MDCDKTQTAERNYGLMTHQQNVLYDLLIQFDALCKEHKLTYWIDGGTLIGAVRHHGFIPWDDDIDVAMPEESYWRLFLLSESLPKGLVFQTEKTDDAYPFCFGKICNSNFPFDTGSDNGPLGVYLDIFPIISSGEGNLIKRALFDLIKIIGYDISVKTKWLPDIPYKNKAARFAFDILRIFPVKVLRKLRWGLIFVIRKRKNGTTYCSPGSNHDARQEFWPRDWCDTQVRMKFEQGMFSVPAGWHEYLSRCYGDYMSLPPEEERKSHHVIRNDKS